MDMVAGKPVMQPGLHGVTGKLRGRTPLPSMSWGLTTRATTVVQ